MRYKPLLLVVAAFAAAACQHGPPASPPKDYKLNGLNVAFSPPSGWKEAREHSSPEMLVDLKTHKAEGTVKSDPWDAVVFEAPAAPGRADVGRISVVALANVTMLDKPQLNAIQDSMLKRNGKRTHDDYYQNVAGDKENGFTIEYEANPTATKPEKGKQVWFVKNGQLISISLQDASADFAADVGQFDNVVRSIRFK